MVPIHPRSEGPLSIIRGVSLPSLMRYRLCKECGGNNMQIYIDQAVLVVIKIEQYAEMIPCLPMPHDSWFLVSATNTPSLEDRPSLYYQSAPRIC